MLFRSDLQFDTQYTGPTSIVSPFFNAIDGAPSIVWARAYGADAKSEMARQQLAMNAATQVRIVFPLG